MEFPDLGNAKKSMRVLEQTDPPTITGPPCRHCEVPLRAGIDTQKKKPYKFWVSCKKCRDKKTAEKRQQKLRRDKRSCPQEAGLPDQQDASPTQQESMPQAMIDLTQEPDGVDMNFETIGHQDSIPSSPVPALARSESPFQLDDGDLLSFFSRNHTSQLRSKMPDTPSEPRLECSVCSVDLPVQPLRLSTCSHDPDLCQGCFRQYLDERMESTAWNSIVCPSVDCSRQITHDDVKKFASPEQFSRFDDLSMRSFLSSDANFRYCLAEGCNSGQVHDGDAAQANIFRCAACHFRVCTVHDVAFHDDETCDQYDSRRQREEQEAHEAWEDDNRRADELTQSQKYMTENSVSCPGCTVQIQKITGCDHMTCTRCRVEFCYICSALYSGPGGIRLAGNTAHLMSCKHHPTRLPAHPDENIEDPDDFV